MKKTIYALVDPRTGDVRYVGASVDLKRRVREHMHRSKRLDSHSARWIRQLLDEGFRPGVWQLAVIEGEWQEVERRWINIFRGLFDLTNIMDGGEGASAGVPKSPETRRKMSEAATRWQTGRKIGSAHRASMSVERKRRYEDSAYRERQADILRGVASSGGIASGVNRRKRASERLQEMNEPELTV